MTHTLKTWKQYFQPQEDGDKLFELRKDDRLFKVGDDFISQEYDPEKKEFTGRETKYKISYVLRGAESFGLKKGFCILNLKAIETF